MLKQYLIYWMKVSIEMRSQLLCENQKLMNELEVSISMHAFESYFKTYATEDQKVKGKKKRIL